MGTLFNQSKIWTESNSDFPASERASLLPMTPAVTPVLPKPGGLQTVAMPSDRFSMLRPLSFGSPICGPWD